MRRPPIAILLLLAACNGSELMRGGPGSECSGSSECEEGTSCFGRVCRTPEQIADHQRENARAAETRAKEAEAERAKQAEEALSPKEKEDARIANERSSDREAVAKELADAQALWKRVQKDKQVQAGTASREQLDRFQGVTILNGTELARNPLCTAKYCYVRSLIAQALVPMGGFQMERRRGDTSAAGLLYADIDIALKMAEQQLQADADP